MLRAVSLAGFFLLALASASASHSCQGPRGDVDWFAAIKFPGGTEYAYMDADSNGQWESSTYDFSQGSDPITSTVKQAYSGSSSDSYLIWNDEPADAAKASRSYGHTKGLIGADSSSGWWLVHSVPKWPSAVENGYEGYPDAESKYGQSFLCVSVRTDTLETIASQIKYMRPKVYSSSITSTVGSKAPTLNSVANGEYVEGSASNAAPFTSYSGKQFNSLAKTGDWDKELYEAFVAPQFSVNLAVESWQNGVGKLQSYCKSSGYSYDAVNVETLSLLGNDWKETQDHSKWAVSTSSSPVTCIGGINRQQGQEVRGGGTVCFLDNGVTSSFRSMIQSTESCSSSEYVAVGGHASTGSSGRSHDTIILSAVFGGLAIALAALAFFVVNRRRQHAQRSEALLENVTALN